MAIRKKTKEEQKKMRVSGRVVHDVLAYCREMCKPGVTTLQLDQKACDFFEKRGAKGLFKNYPTYKPGEGFPSNLCISVNDTVVHGIADDTEIKDGDIVSFDCGVTMDGWCGDSATTVLVGNVDPATRRLCETTQSVLQLAIDNIKPGRKWSQVARIMQGHAEKAGYGVVRDFVGHGIGQAMHEEPKVPNFVSRELLKNDILLQEGMVLAVEPMCNLGSKDVLTLDDGWTVKTVDGQASAHYEHTIVVTATGCEVLTDGR